ncbi:MAG: DUF5395 domain-containing protein [Acidobacteria bacterium]|nr:DUF5395 domain-containing protein [Acidobacteriota bacterium]
MTSSPARLAASRGALPLEPRELVLLQVLLRHDEDPEVAAAAAHSLEELDADLALTLAEDRDTAPEVLALLAHEASRWPAAATTLAGRRDLDPACYRALAAAPDGEPLDVLALNQEALAADPVLGALLTANPALPGQGRARLLDFLDELAKLGSGLAAEGAPAVSGPTETEADALPRPARDPFLASLGIDAEVEALLPQLDLDLGMLAERSELLGEPEEGDDVSLITRLSKMNVGQKLRAALFGSREERSILVRDTNRLIACSVVKNPKFTVTEADQAAKSRNISTDVLRLISRHRDFGKAYSIQKNLVVNPRCPPDIALNLVPVLNDHDLKLMVRNRNLGEAVRRQAKKVFEIREARKRVRVMPGKH